MKIAYLVMSVLLGSITSQAFAETAVEKYHLNWITDSSQNIEEVKTQIHIQAPAALVWSIIKDPNHYSDWTKQASAKTSLVAPGSKIKFCVDLNDWWGRTHSTEKITVVDESLYAIAWEKNMGFGIHTQRWQFLIPSHDGRSVTYYTGLKIPGPYGSTLQFFGMMKKLSSFLIRFSMDLKAKSEGNLFYEKSDSDSTQLLEEEDHTPYSPWN